MSLYRTEDQARRKRIVEDYRGPWRRDFGRVIHSPSFRRLQGKTQLFPGFESDFFRNRLTHSLEVAQIAKSIALYINATFGCFQTNGINPEIVEIAGLLHDFGHPPFGHNGERALDDKMACCGGFEGNAQTLRIITSLEKKENDPGFGLNLTHRVMASILKYDTQIREKRDKEKDNRVIKGYYGFDRDIVQGIKQAVTGDKDITSFKTIECQIMDMADDIAYSVYDLEDAFKAGFLTPLKMLNIALEESDIGTMIANKVREKVPSFSREQLGVVVCKLIDLFAQVEKGRKTREWRELALFLYKASEEMANVGNVRINFTSNLIGKFIQGIDVEWNPRYPALSKVFFQDEIKEQIEVLKQFTYVTLINSSMLKVTEYRGYGIVTEIFDALNNDGGRLLPADFKAVYDECRGDGEKRRVICDFIAGMTDRYALEFYGRLKTISPQTIFKPL